MTLHAHAARARSALEQAGIPPAMAALDAELLARYVLGWDRATWLSHSTDGADSSFESSYADVIARRIAREPVAYIRGFQEFWGRDFVVSPAVLIPRPETELVIEAAQCYLRTHPSASVVDVGTGSGCIAITLALEHPTLRVRATDISSEALAIARLNAARLGAIQAVEFHQAALMDIAEMPVDLIVSNPPYVALADRPGLAPEVAREPSIALFGGEDGLDVVRQLLGVARDTLEADGRLIVEIGDGQLAGVERELSSLSGMVLEEVRQDLQGIPRVVVARSLLKRIVGRD